MNKRPTSVTVICILLILFGSLTLLSGVMMYFLQGHEAFQEAMRATNAPAWVQITVAIVSALLQIGCAIAMLKGVNPARFVYAATAVSTLVYSFAVTPLKPTLFLSVIYLGVVFYFLFRETATDFFTARG